MTRAVKPRQRQLLEDGDEATAQRQVVTTFDAVLAPRYGLPPAALYHVPNGGSRDFIEACQLKLQGVRRGIPDLFLAKPSAPYHGLFIELKRPTGGRMTDEQKAFLTYARAAGYCAFCCHGAENALRLLEIYITFPEALSSYEMQGLTFGAPVCPFGGG